MQYRKLPKDEEKISVLGIGTWTRDKVHFQIHFGANYETGIYSHILKSGDDMEDKLKRVTLHDLEHGRQRKSDEKR